MGVEPKIGGGPYPKMDGENNGSKPYEQMDDFLGVPLFLETPISFEFRKDTLQKMGPKKPPKKHTTPIKSWPYVDSCLLRYS